MGYDSSMLLGVAFLVALARGFNTHNIEFLDCRIAQPTLTTMRETRRLSSLHRLDVRLLAKKKRSVEDNRTAQEAGQAPRKKRVRKKVAKKNSDVVDGEAVEIAEVKNLVRKRKVTRLGAGGSDLDKFISDENVNESLPDFGEIPEFDAEKLAAVQRQDVDVDDGVKGDGGLLDGVFKVQGVIKDLVDPPPKNVKPSDDYFDQGFGLVFKNFVFFLSFAAIVWEIYISFFMERKLPVQTFEQAIVGYGRDVEPFRGGSNSNSGSGGSMEIGSIGAMLGTSTDDRATTDAIAESVFPEIDISQSQQQPRH